jgi:hypothetical protein
VKFHQGIEERLRELTTCSYEAGMFILKLKIYICTDLNRNQEKPIFHCVHMYTQLLHHLRSIQSTVILSWLVKCPVLRSLCEVSSRYRGAVKRINNLFVWEKPIFHCVHMYTQLLHHLRSIQSTVLGRYSYVSLVLSSWLVKCPVLRSLCEVSSRYRGAVKRINNLFV